ncbi:DASH family cryptochrome [Pseudoalteromonas spongiae]|uniref:Cryptochrome DASH n=1 Tax=Pseudoalteromonas spongiae TaxID=298657 RepID=A0ABU8EX27_9GAMM
MGRFKKALYCVELFNLELRTYCYSLQSVRFEIVLNTLYWFTHDLRLSDNAALEYALKNSEQIAFVYVLDPSTKIANNYHSQLLGDHQTRFILNALQELADELQALGHQLIVLEGETQGEVGEFIREHDINQLVVAEQVGEYERRQVLHLKNTFPEVNVVQFWQHTLFTQHQIAELDWMSGSFSKFRNKVEKMPLTVSTPTSLENTLTPEHWPKAIKVDNNCALLAWFERYDGTYSMPNDMPFFAGEHAGKYHLVSYLNSGAAKTYKDTRNELDGWHNSTKFSPYLAIGNLSPRQIWHAVLQYERSDGANESTYWIKFELLWREYFQWLSLKLGKRLYAFSGLREIKPLTSFFAERYQKWCSGNTPYPLVNALMKQLNTTGYMSNRGRQIAASCFINELQLDWRYGAAYFQQQLIDFDVASNWGNWQYIAGVGVDPRGGRHFNIEKQTELFDAKGVFIRKWQGSAVGSQLDANDAADWPILSDVT